MFELFTEPARQAVRASNDTAIALGHDFIGTEHMLLALADTPGGASDLLR
ncbi:Clp protease N-terminal domain-containing protein, partial [Kibdelosporangium lantanae]